MPQNTTTVKRYSVCVGINTYSPLSALDPLKYAENDARAMDALLGKLGFAPENRTLLLGQSATLEAVNAALETMIFDRAREHDLVVFFYAGHSEPVLIGGEPSDAGESEVFLTSYDFNYQKISTTPSFRTQHALGMRRLKTTFFESPGGSRKRLFIFDSCHSGDFYGPDYRAATSSIQNSMKNMLESRSTGRVFLASCLPYQQAVESSLYEHGRFTYYLLKALEGAPDARRKNGTVTVGSMFDYIADQLPHDQRPVKGGVEQDSFVLADYSDLVLPKTQQTGALGDAGRNERLRAICTDQVAYVQDRLQRFVGRQRELDELQRRVATKIEEGGYVVITGDAGQGKSSIIAKMIADRDLHTTAYHFIQPGSGANHPLNVLRNLMARLILKYNLPEHYVAGESYPILSGNFLGVLKAIAEQKVQEVIYIDGLDQLEMGTSAAPDLSMLPSRLPPGIVLVVGTRPNKALKDLVSYVGVRSEDRYELHGLSREDFDRLLHHRNVPAMSVALSDSLYQRLTNNSLYLDLVAQELQASQDLTPEALIARVENNPNNIFTIAFSRMAQQPEWYNIIRPLLGVLLVAQEPLTAQQIAHIIRQERVRIRTGITQLGGLLTLAGQQHYTLFHPKLGEYLQPDVRDPDNEIQFDTEEVETQHGQIVDWCEQGPVERLWEKIADPAPRDDYQDYAQKHYIMHLYRARRYQRLFAVLNDGSYERGKLAFDQSTRSSAVDLLLGCQAAAHGVRTREEGIELLVNLWRYTLLRTSLTTRADAYPLTAFQALLALGREQEALDLAELLTQPAAKIAVLIVMTEYFLKQPAREADGLQLYSRVYEIAVSMKDRAIQTRALSDLTSALLRAEHLIQAMGIAQLIVDIDEQAAALNKVSAAYAEQGNWPQAEHVAHLIALDERRVQALSHLAAQLMGAEEGANAEGFWQEASTIASAITDNEKQQKALYYLFLSFIEVQEWERAANAIGSLTGAETEIKALCQLALSYKQAGLAAQADATWDEVQAAIEARDEQERDAIYRMYAIALIQAGLSEQAEIIAKRRILHPAERVVVFERLASYLINTGDGEQSKHVIEQIVAEYDRTDVGFMQLDNILVRLSMNAAARGQWEEARDLALTVTEKEARCRALMGIVSHMAQAGMSQRAQAAWEEARDLCFAQTETVQGAVASTIVETLVKAGQIVQARQLIPTLAEKQTRTEVLEVLGIALADANQIAEAEQIADEITHTLKKASIQSSIACAQMRMGQPERAIATAQTIALEERRSQTLADLVTICCQNQQWDLARNIAREIPSAPVQAEAQFYLIEALVRSYQLKDAEELVRSIGNGYYKTNAWSVLTTAYVQIGGGRDRAMGYIQRYIKKNSRIRQKAECNILLAMGAAGIRIAEPTAYTIERSNERNEALYNVAVAYAHANMWEEAKRLAEAIEEPQIQDSTWATLACELAKAGEWPQATTLFDKIQQTSHRITVLQEWGTLLAQSPDQEIRAHILLHLSDRKERASLLVRMATVMATTGNVLEQIHFTQQAWLQASTKDDCQYLFAMIQGLLEQTPACWADFYGSFNWVSTFL